MTFCRLTLWANRLRSVGSTCGDKAASKPADRARSIEFRGEDNGRSRDVARHLREVTESHLQDAFDNTIHFLLPLRTQSCTFLP
jgi:hypothetical protein